MTMCIKRGASVFLAAVMCLALLPMTVLGATNSSFAIKDGVMIGYTGPGGEVVIPEGVTAIGSHVFRASRSRQSITSLVFPSSVKSIETNAFEYMRNLERVTLNNGLEIIGVYAFWDCKGLNDIVIPDSVTVISRNAFRDAGLRSVTIGSGVREIGDHAFAECMSLRNVTIPASVESIGIDAFRLGHSDKKVTITGAPGSAAEAFARANGNPFITMGSAAPASPQPAPSNPAPSPNPAPAATPAPSHSASNTPSPWAQSEVATAINSGIVPASLQSAYKQATTRAEFCALAVALYEKLKGEIMGRSTFSDTSDVNVQKAAAVGVAGGVGGNRFAPDRPLTREEAAAMLSRLAEAVGRPLPSQASGFSDGRSISTWALEDVGRVQGAGIMGGTGGNMFTPKGSYTREQSILTMLRLHIIATGGEIPQADPRQQEPPAQPPAQSLPVSDSLKRNMTDIEFQKAYAAASEIAARLAGQSREDQLKGVYREIRHISETKIEYSMTDKHYNTVYGFFIVGVASCAGATRATGLLLTILGFSYEHVNESQAMHQWCRVNLGGTYWIVDSFGLYVGHEPAPYEHPWF